MIPFSNRRALVAVCAVIAASCAPQRTPTASAPTPAPTAAPVPTRPTNPATTAAAILRDPSGRQVGSLNFSDTYAGLLITGTVTDLGLGAHGFHLHAVGKCEAPFTTAGAHFNPTNQQHGYRSATGPHLGDLPNLDLPAAGAQRFEMVVPNVTLKGRNALLDSDGASIVVHSSRDDYATDPAGNSGGRIACGVIVQR